MGNPLAPGLTPVASVTLPAGRELSAVSAANSSVPLLHQVCSCSSSAAGIILLFQLALKDHADKQCCIVLLSCKQSDSRSFLGCISCMIIARLCCFTGFVCTNTIHGVTEMHDMQCCCHVFGDFERQVARPMPILIHVWDVLMSVSTTELLIMTASKLHCNFVAASYKCLRPCAGRRYSFTGWAAPTCTAEQQHAKAGQMAEEAEAQQNQPHIECLVVKQE